MTEVQDRPVTEKAPKKKGASEEPAPQIQLSRIEAQTMIVPIVGTSPLIIHKFSEKAKKAMLDAMQGRKSPRENKDPDREYNDAFYFIGDPAERRYGFPVIAFKAATVGGARFFAGVTMTALRQFLFLRGEMGENGQQMAVIEGEPHMREDVVRVNRGGTDLRYRPEFFPWRTDLTVTFVKSALTQGSVLSLIDAGGLGVGVGEWRTEKGGDFGGFKVDPDRDIQVISG
jgi:hypothetical protein